MDEHSWLESLMEIQLFFLLFNLFYFNVIHFLNLVFIFILCLSYGGQTSLQLNPQVNKAQMFKHVLNV